MALEGDSLAIADGSAGLLFLDTRRLDGAVPPTPTPGLVPMVYLPNVRSSTP